jgi:hypothetical protein
MSDLCIDRAKTSETDGIGAFIIQITTQSLEIAATCHGPNELSEGSPAG